VDNKGIPNSIYAGCIKKLQDGRILIVDNHFDKTKRNIMSSTKGSVLFITKESQSFHIKGTVEYHADGDMYTDMKAWVDPKYPVHGAAVVNVEEVYCGAKRLL